MARCTQGKDDNFVYFLLDLNNIITAQSQSHTRTQAQAHARTQYLSSCALSEQTGQFH